MIRTSPRIPDLSVPLVEFSFPKRLMEPRVYHAKFWIIRLWMNISAMLYVPGGLCHCS
jgi:hypothetical protein